MQTIIELKLDISKFHETGAVKRYTKIESTSAVTCNKEVEHSHRTTFTEGGNKKLGLGNS